MYPMCKNTQPRIGHTVDTQSPGNPSFHCVGEENHTLYIRIPVKDLTHIGWLGDIGIGVVRSG